ncbi:hypothetical protein E5Q_05015 [Mixia osmundae IAM 14324]|uniref:Rab proteins geranylgeranyltransferase n=1 Tax=Mixia osmundae (strain CBS 9802 / IAM 14324 / JCM 22182 / KY 12970) TaxID=764103 RepID=G7E670_MIXOS|nr:hypothetical protein E5Q_05015 [Mixia osmundae IAM 14324]
MLLEPDDRTHFDAIILGTGLAESILAASLAKAGKTVFHLDSNRYYGSKDASLSLAELTGWISARQQSPTLSSASASDSTTYRLDHLSNERSIYSHVSSCFPSVNHPQETLMKESRSYALSLSPSLLPASCEFVTSLVTSGVHHYTGFQLLAASYSHEHNDGQTAWRKVPMTKQDVFVDSSLSLPDKHRLMKFIRYASQESTLDLDASAHFSETLSTQFGLKQSLIDGIACAAALSSSGASQTGAALQRLSQYLSGVGRFGTSPFLVGQYGGAGEVAQGFCRVCAVHGGVYVLGGFEVDVDALRPSITLYSNADATGEQQTITADHLFAAPSYLPPGSLQASLQQVSRYELCAILILDAPIAIAPVESAEQDDDEAPKQDNLLFVFPPSTADGEAASTVFALQTTSSTYACPDGRAVLHVIAMTSEKLDAKAYLTPFIRKLLSGKANILFEAFFTRALPDIRQGVGKLQPVCSMTTEGVLAQSCQDALTVATRLHRLVADSPPFDTA